MRSSCSALQVRRFGLATTSGSRREAGTGSAPALAAAALRCGSPGGEPSLRSAAAKPPGERTTPREFPFISDLFFLALLLLIKSTKPVSEMLARRAMQMDGSVERACFVFGVSFATMLTRFLKPVIFLMPSQNV